MRSEFHDVFKDAYDYWIDDACTHRYHASKSLALQVWQHQQSKVDELQKRVDAVNLVLEGLKNANYMHSGNKAYNSLLIEKLEQALKGGGE